MIWLGWRQQRMEAVIAALLLALLAAFLIPTGLNLAGAYEDGGLAACIGQTSPRCRTLLDAFEMRFEGVTGLFAWLQLAPGVIGALLAAPIVLELEQRTFRLSWTQSVTRRHWLAVKLGLVALSALVAAALLTAMLTWWRQPLDDLHGRMSENTFSVEGIVPYAYMLFAAALALALGVVLRRVAAAIGLTVILFLFIRLSFVDWVRPHFQDPLVKIWQGGPGRLGLENAWVLSAGPVDRSGNRVAVELMDKCAPSSPAQEAAAEACLQRLGVVSRAVYHPADRFWTFQWIEAAIFVGAAAALTGFAAWWIVKRVS